METLTKANRELFRRSPDERFATLDQLWEHCYAEKEQSREQWLPPDEIHAVPVERAVALRTEKNEVFRLNDWSFSQMCRFAGVSKETVTRLAPETAAQVLRETFPGGTKPIQMYTLHETVRAIHPASYTRLHNADLVQTVRQFAPGFTPPQQAAQGGTGLYCGEQDMFCFLIDPTGWAEIEDQAFAPGFFLWNSEVGRRSVGIQTFWFQAVCQNHLVWDAVEVMEFSRKHTANVHESLASIRSIIEWLVEQRDERRNGFVSLIRKAMATDFNPDAEKALKLLTEQGITQALAREALESARRQRKFTIFSVVDALTRLSQKSEHAGARVEADIRAGRLLALAA